MSVGIAHPPRTIREVFDNLPEGTLAQLIENNLVMSPAPLDVHQKVLVDIHLSIGVYVKQKEIGQTRVAPYDVYLDDENIFQPDIVVILNEHLNLIKRKGLYGAPDMVIEILSSSTAKYDQEKKKSIYEEYGVKEYWIVEPFTKSVEGYKLTNGIFTTLSNEEGVIKSELLQSEFRF